MFSWSNNKKVKSSKLDKLKQSILEEIQSQIYLTPKEFLSTFNYKLKRKTFTVHIFMIDNELRASLESLYGDVYENISDYFEKNILNSIVY